MGAPSLSDRRWFDIVVVGLGLIVAILVVAANRPRIDPPWPPPPFAVARANVRRDPLDVAALRDLSFAMLKAGDREGGGALMAFAAERSWRDTPAQAWKLGVMLDAGRYDTAAQVADSLLRRDTGDALRERLFALLIAMARFDVPRRALVARLTAEPWWRLTYLRKLSATADPAVTRAVLLTLELTPPGPSLLEIAPHIDRLVSMGAYRQAAADWTALTARRPADLADLVAPAPFGWSEVFGPGGSSQARAGVLEVEYDGYLTPQLPRRLLAAPPGAYNLSWRDRVETDGKSGIAVAVLCAGSTTVLARLSTEPHQGWLSRELRFSVPDTGCAGQWLALLPLPGSRRSTVSADFSDWRLLGPGR